MILGREEISYTKQQQRRVAEKRVGKKEENVSSRRASLLFHLVECHAIGVNLAVHRSYLFYVIKHPFSREVD
jgi:hypothetical protein